MRACCVTMCHGDAERESGGDQAPHISTAEAGVESEGGGGIPRLMSGLLISAERSVLELQTCAQHTTPGRL